MKVQLIMDIDEIMEYDKFGALVDSVFDTKNDNILVRFGTTDDGINLISVFKEGGE